MEDHPRFLIRLALAATLAAGCDADRTVTVGVVAPLTGQCDLYGEPIVHGIELAHRQLSDDPSFPRRIVLDVRDSESDPRKAATRLRELYRSGAMVVIGAATTPEALEMIPVVEAEEQVLISPAATGPGLTGRSSLFFRVAPSGFHEGVRMGKLAAQELGVETVALLAADSLDGEGVHDVFASEFERYGGEVVAAIEYPAGAADLRAPLAEALAADPGALYLTGHALEIGRLLDQLEQRGYPGRILTTSALAAAGESGRMGEPPEGLLWTSPVFEPDGDAPATRRFVHAYEEEHETRPGFLAAQAYDAMRVVGAVLRKPEVVSARGFYRELRNLPGFVSAAGAVQFDDQGDVGKFPRVYMIQDGEPVAFDTVIERRKKVLEELEDLRRRQLETGRRSAGDAAAG